MNTEQLDLYEARNAGLSYYDGPDIVEHLRAVLTGAGLDPDALQIDDLAPIDEFHALGRAATAALAGLAPLRRDDRVLDVGAGIGGPARFLAARYGALVTALDGTVRFCEAAELLTRATGLAERVHVVHGDALALPFADAAFDVVWSQAVSQNIEQKERFVAELARVVRPGGHVALFEVVAGPGGPLKFPVPWADGEDQSWLVTADALHELLESETLTITAWNEGQAALDAIAGAARSMHTPPAERQLGLDLLMPDFEARMAGLARNVAEQRITLLQAVARRGD